MKPSRSLETGQSSDEVEIRLNPEYVLGLCNVAVRDPKGGRPMARAAQIPMHKKSTAADSRDGARESTLAVMSNLIDEKVTKESQRTMTSARRPLLLSEIVFPRSLSRSSRPRVLLASLRCVASGNAAGLL